MVGSFSDVTIDWSAYDGPTSGELASSKQFALQEKGFPANWHLPPDELLSDDIIDDSPHVGMMELVLSQILKN